MESLRYPGGLYSKQDEDEPRDDPKHPVHHMLLWIVCVDNHCRMHQYLKQQVSRYLQRMYWPPAAAKHRNAKYMHGWRALEYQSEHLLIVQLGRFFTEEYLEG